MAIDLEDDGIAANGGQGTDMEGSPPDQSLPTTTPPLVSIVYIYTTTNPTLQSTNPLLIDFILAQQSPWKYPSFTVDETRVSQGRGAHQGMILTCKMDIM